MTPHTSLWVEGLCTHYNVMKLYNTSFNPYIRLTENGAQIYFEGEPDRFTTVEDWTSFLAGQAESGTPVELLYVLATPIETDLPDEVIDAYQDYIRSHSGDTVVSNDAGAHMEIKYIMDARKYIDKMISTGIHEATLE